MSILHYENARLQCSSFCFAISPHLYFMSVLCLHVILPTKIRSLALESLGNEINEVFSQNKPILQINKKHINTDTVYHNTLQLNPTTARSAGIQSEAESSKQAPFCVKSHSTLQPRFSLAPLVSFHRELILTGWVEISSLLTLHHCLIDPTWAIGWLPEVPL